MTGSVLFVSRHDYRTDLRVSVHFLAEEFRADFDTVEFMSVAFSPLIRGSRDARSTLAGRANRWEEIEGVRCFLWSMPWHPVSVGGPLLRRFTGLAFDLWSWWPCAALDEAARRASLIIVQSGPAPALIRRLRRQAPQAQIIYFAEDLLDAAGVHPRVQSLLEASAPSINRVVVAARSMLPHFRRFGSRVEYIPHGLDRRLYDRPTPSPFGPGRHVVTVGSMLFDASVIDVAARAFPDVYFHLIGTPEGPAFPGNVHEHGRMSFADTIPYLQHADLGIAPYRRAAASDYLADSSLKLMQFGYLGVPAVCPGFAVGDKPLRSGYRPGDPTSIRKAFEAAFAMIPQAVSVPSLSWRQVADAFLRRDRVSSPERREVAA